VPLSWIQSFYDAPGGFREEMHEIMHKVGTEVRINYQNKLYAAIRMGRIMEHSTKGNRKFNTIGIGVGAFGFTLDGKFIIASAVTPLHNTYAITLGFCANLDGKPMRF
jgi:coproporphyrinogen III oxidase-like Fe-S oxidoreductase